MKTIFILIGLSKLVFIIIKYNSDTLHDLR